MRRAKSLSATGSPPDGRPVHGHLKDSGVCLDNLNHQQTQRNLTENFQKSEKISNQRGSVGSASGVGPGSVRWTSEDERLVVGT